MTKHFTKMKQNNNPVFEEQINFIDLALKIKESKSLIFWTTLIFTLSALIYGLQKPDLYKTTILINPTVFEFPSGLEEPIQPIKETLEDLKIKKIYGQLRQQNDIDNLKFSIFENQLIRVDLTSLSENDNLSRINKIIEELVFRDEDKAISQLKENKKQYTVEISSFDRQIDFTKKIESQKLIDLKNQYQLLESQKTNNDFLTAKLDILRQISQNENSVKVFELIEEKKALESELQNINETNITLAKIYSESTQTITPKIALITALGFFGGLFASLILMLLNELSLTQRSNKL